MSKSTDRKDKLIAGSIVAGLAALIVGGEVLHAHLVYGDWTCAIAKCVKVSGSSAP